MVRYERRLRGLFLPIALMGLTLFTTHVIAQRVKTETIVSAPPTLSLTAEPAVVTACADQTQPAQVRLRANATSPEGRSINYRWQANDGRIAGEGAIAAWDLSGLQPGYYRAFVTIGTGNGEEHCEAFSSIAVLVNSCPAPKPVCPTVVVSCPEKMVLGQPLDFTASVTGGTPGITPVYNWTVSAGTILSGQGTSSIRVDTTGLAGQSVVAKLSMAGYPMDCSATCVAQLPIPIECKKFDEFPVIARNDEKARLDNYAIELQNDPAATAYVVVSPGKKGKTGEVQRHTTRVVDYLISSRSIDGHRIVTMVGPPQPELDVQLWTCPQGATPESPRR